MTSAARKGDQHACPQTGHSVNAITTGSSNVFINGIPAARLGDSTSCGATIISGSSTVFINGVPAVITGSATSHGGVIITGSSNVLIGDSYAPNFNTHDPSLDSTKNVQKNNRSTDSYIDNNEIQKEIKIKKIFWSYGEQNSTLLNTSRHFSDVNLHIETEDYTPGENVELKIHIENDDLEKETLIVNATVDSQGKAVIKNVITNKTISIISQY